jgi:hypothetical protein
MCFENRSPKWFLDQMYRYLVPKNRGQQKV